MNCIYFSDLEGIFQYYGSKKTQRLPVSSGFHIQLRFSTETCKGQLVEITSEDTNLFLRIAPPGIGPIRVSYNNRYGKKPFCVITRRSLRWQEALSLVQRPLFSCFISCRQRSSKVLPGILKTTVSVATKHSFWQRA